MFRRKESPKSVVLLLLLFAGPLSAGLGTRAPIDRAIVGNGMFLAGTNGKLIFKKPAGYTDKDFLWQILYETAIDKHIVHTKIKMYANTIRELCLKNPDLLQKKRWGKKPQIFAMYNCHYQIGRAIDALLPSTEYKAIGYKKSPKKTSKDAIEWAKKYAVLVSKKVLAHTKSYIRFGDLAKNVTFKSVTLDENSFDVVFEAGKYALYDASVFTLSIYPAGVDKKCFDGQIGLVKFTCANKQCENAPLEIDLDLLDVNRDFRQCGFGRVMMLVVLNFARGLAKARKSSVVIKLLALPNQASVLPVLINYYKSFGFIPKFKENDYLTMHIDKTGKILTLQELKK